MSTCEMSIQTCENAISCICFPLGDAPPRTASPLCHDLGVLVESVPNYSEGRRLDVVDRFAEAVRATTGAYLLDRTSDASHNRSVLTLAGNAPAVERALEATIEVAIEAIEMERHTGEHPRIGA